MDRQSVCGENSVSFPGEELPDKLLFYLRVKFGSVL